MKKDELAIEESAQKYFRDPSRSNAAANKLLEEIYNNNEFVIRIISNAAKKYESVISDLKQLKHEAVLRTFATAKNEYKYEKGSFIKYFSSNLKYHTENILKKECKKEKELIFDEPISGEDGKSVNLIDTQESNVDSAKNIEETIYREEFLLVLMNTLNKLFLSSMAGQENKSKVYTYFVLESLLNKTEDVFYEYLCKHEFLNMQKQNLLKIRKEFLQNRKIPNQKEFAKITGIPETKIAAIKTKLEKELRSDSEIQIFMDLG